MEHRYSTRIMKDGIVQVEVANRNVVLVIRDAPETEHGYEVLEWQTTITDEELAVERPRKPVPVDPDGPGSIFADWMVTIGIKKQEGCQCGEIQKLMDREGPDWCEDNVEEICLMIEMSLLKLKKAAKESDDVKFPLMMKLYNRRGAKVAILLACKESRKRKAAKNEGG